MAILALGLVFALGVANFALHRAAMDSRSTSIRQFPWLATRRGRRLALSLEFAVLLAAMLLVANGWPEAGWGYLVYTLANGLSAWLILSDRL